MAGWGLPVHDDAGPPALCAPGLSRFVSVAAGPHRAPQRWLAPGDRGAGVPAGSPPGLQTGASGPSGPGPPAGYFFPLTSMPRTEEAEPIKVPHNGNTSLGSQATATRIRLRLPIVLLVGSKSTHPAPGR